MSHNEKTGGEEKKKTWGGVERDQKTSRCFLGAAKTGREVEKNRCTEGETPQQKRVNSHIHPTEDCERKKKGQLYPQGIIPDSKQKRWERGKKGHTKGRNKKSRTC